MTALSALAVDNESNATTVRTLPRLLTALESQLLVKCDIYTCNHEDAQVVVAMHTLVHTLGHMAPRTAPPEYNQLFGPAGGASSAGSTVGEARSVPGVISRREEVGHCARGNGIVFLHGEGLPKQSSILTRKLVLVSHGAMQVHGSRLLQRKHHPKFVFCYEFVTCVFQQSNLGCLCFLTPCCAPLPSPTTFQHLIDSNYMSLGQAATLLGINLSLSAFNCAAPLSITAQEGLSRVQADAVETSVMVRRQRALHLAEVAHRVNEDCLSGMRSDNARMAANALASLYHLSVAEVGVVQGFTRHSSYSHCTVIV